MDEIVKRIPLEWVPVKNAFLSCFFFLSTVYRTILLWNIRQNIEFIQIRWMLKYFCWKLELKMARCHRMTFITLFFFFSSVLKLATKWNAFILVLGFLIKYQHFKISQKYDFSFFLPNSQMPLVVYFIASKLNRMKNILFDEIVTRKLYQSIVFF